MCNGQFSKRGNDARVINLSGWQNLKSKAEVWSKVNVPILNELYHFPQVHDKVKKDNINYATLCNFVLIDANVNSILHLLK